MVRFQKCPSCDGTGKKRRVVHPHGRKSRGVVVEGNCGRCRGAGWI